MDKAAPFDKSKGNPFGSVQGKPDIPQSTSSGPISYGHKERPQGYFEHAPATPEIPNDLEHVMAPVRDEIAIHPDAQQAGLTVSDAPIETPTQHTQPTWAQATDMLRAPITSARHWWGKLMQLNLMRAWRREKANAGHTNS